MPGLALALIAFAAAGLFLALPGRGPIIVRAGAVLLLGALAGAVTLAIQMAGDGGGRWMFGLLTLITLVAAVRVVTHEKPVYSALYFILVVLSTAGMMIMMQAEFLAAAIVIIYGGAILVTYVFVIMLAQQGQQQARYDTHSREPLLGALAGVTIVAVITSRLLGAGTAPALADAAPLAGTVRPVGSLMLTEYVVAVQLAGVLLLAAMVGAIAIAKRQPLADETQEAD